MILSSLRRWYFLLVGLILTGAATYMVFGMISPTYAAKASMVLIPPKVAVTVGDNPYLYMGGLDQALGVLQVKVASPAESAALIDKYPGAEISIAKDATTSGPIISVQVSANDANNTMALLKESIDLVPKSLTALQDELKVPDQSLISVMEISSDNEPTKIAKKQLQMTIIVAAGGASASLLGTGLLDRLINRRTTRKKAKANAAETFTRLSTVGNVDAGEPATKKSAPLHSRKLRRSVPSREIEEVKASAADVGT